MHRFTFLACVVLPLKFLIMYILPILQLVNQSQSQIDINMSVVLTRLHQRVGYNIYGVACCSTHHEEGQVDPLTCNDQGKLPLHFNGNLVYGICKIPLHSTATIFNTVYNVYSGSYRITIEGQLMIIHVKCKIILCWYILLHMLS